MPSLSFHDNFVFVGTVNDDFQLDTQILKFIFTILFLNFERTHDNFKRMILIYELVICDGIEDYMCFMT